MTEPRRWTLKGDMRGVPVATGGDVLPWRHSVEAIELTPEVERLLAPLAITHGPGCPCSSCFSSRVAVQWEAGDV